MLSINERTLYKSKCSTATFYIPIILILIGFCIYWVGLIFWIPGVIWLLYEILNYISSVFIITDKRVIIKYGVFSRNILELNINKVEGIDVKQGIIGRILNYGAISIKAMGAGNIWHRGVNEPNSFKKSLYKVLNNE